jgi:hypothetical protein
MGPKAELKARFRPGPAPSREQVHSQSWQRRLGAVTEVCCQSTGLSMGIREGRRNSATGCQKLPAKSWPDLPQREG